MICFAIVGGARGEEEGLESHACAARCGGEIAMAHVAHTYQEFTEDAALDGALYALHETGGNAAAASTKLQKSKSQLRYAASREMLPLAVIVRRQSGAQAASRSPEQQWEAYLAKLAAIPEALRRKTIGYKLAMKQHLRLTAKEFRALHTLSLIHISEPTRPY